MERLWWSRLRWRLRGAWLWPAFVLLTILDGLALHLLPISGEGPEAVGGILLAGVANLIAVALLGSAIGRLLRRRATALPRVVADDRGGTVALLVVTLGLLGGGIVHRPAVSAEHADESAAASAVRRYVLASAPPEYHATLAAADTLRLDSDLYRTCMPGRDRRPALCLLVDTGRRPAGIRVDPNRGTNRAFLARGGPGG